MIVLVRASVVLGPLLVSWSLVRCSWIRLCSVVLRSCLSVCDSRWLVLVKLFPLIVTWVLSRVLSAVKGADLNLLCSCPEWVLVLVVSLGVVFGVSVLVSL